ncbi:MAG: MFS transporter [Clostridia bacterium]|nr:MFS transporter [Clostridia bacterium]
MEPKSAFTRRKKLGYAFGIAAESMLYNMYYTYFLTFLVQVAHIRPQYAGVIIFISIGWDAITDPILGSISDRPGMNKQKLMLKSVLPLCVLFVLAWSTLGNTMFGDAQLPKIILYTVISLGVWLFYTIYTIPYYSVIAELTEDYDERTKIRSMSSFINAFCIGLGNILPALVDVKGEGGLTFLHIAVILAVLALASGLVCCVSLKGVYHVRDLKPGERPGKGLGVKADFMAFAEVAKLKPVKYFLFFVFFFLVGNSMLQSNLSYMVVYSIGADYNDGIAIVIGVLVITLAATVPLVTKIAEKTDRRLTCLIFITVAALGLVVPKLVGMDVTVGSFKVMLVVIPFLLGLGLSTFWTFFYSMSYDIVELDEFVNGKNGERRESVITSLPQLLQKSGSATGILMQGLILGAYGYDTAQDTGADAALFKEITDPHVIGGMTNVSTVIPAAIMAVALVFLLLYPFTRKNYERLTEQLRRKRAGEPYTTEGLERLVK